MRSPNPFVLMDAHTGAGQFFTIPAQASRPTRRGCRITIDPRHRSMIRPIRYSAAAIQSTPSSAPPTHRTFDQRTNVVYSPAEWSFRRRPITRTLPRPARPMHSPLLGAASHSGTPPRPRIPFRRTRRAEGRRPRRAWPRFRSPTAPIGRSLRSPSPGWERRCAFPSRSAVGVARYRRHRHRRLLAACRLARRTRSSRLAGRLPHRARPHLSQVKSSRWRRLRLVLRQLRRSRRAAPNAHHRRSRQAMGVSLQGYPLVGAQPTTIAPRVWNPIRRPRGSRSRSRSG